LFLIVAFKTLTFDEKCSWFKVALVLGGEEDKGREGMEGKG